METEPGGSFYPLYESLILLSSTPILGVGIAFIVLLLLLFSSAMVSGSEVAYFSLDANHVDGLKNKPDKTEERILSHLEQKPYLLATILVANNFINIAIILVSAYILGNLLPESWNEYAKFSIEVIFVTFLLVLFGEVSPKVYAGSHNVKLARTMAQPLEILSKITYPITIFLVSATTIIEKRIEKYDLQQVSMEDIDQAIELSVTDTQHAKQEIRLLKSIVKFGNVSVKQIMRSRMDVTAVEQDTSFHELIKLVRESGFSRIPVYDDNSDNVKGILYAKDLLEHLNKPDDYNWNTIPRPAYFVPETKKIDDLLKNFQEKHVHMAIVVDEYGGMEGIVTLEDILEEIIGEIQDEFDQESELEYRRLDDYNYIFEGKTMLNDVCRVVGLDTTTFDEIKGDSDSLAGLILEIAGRFPKTKQVISHENYHFKIIEADKRRIIQVKITLPKGNTPMQIMHQ